VAPGARFFVNRFAAVSFTRHGRRNLPSRHPKPHDYQTNFIPHDYVLILLHQLRLVGRACTRSGLHRLQIRRRNRETIQMYHPFLFAGW